MRSQKPEQCFPSWLHYDETEAEKYTRSSQNAKIQVELTERCIELLQLNNEKERSDIPLVLDVGCGSGLSSQVVTENYMACIGIDNASEMLKLAQQADPSSMLIQSDIGKRMNFRNNTFDGVISVSVIQWLCHAFSAKEDPNKRLKTFFDWLYSCMKPTAKAVLQYYPKDENQQYLIAKIAAKSGFNTFFMIDNSESKRKRKIFLILTKESLAQTITDSETDRHRKDNNKKESHKKWVVRKKEKLRAQGRPTKTDSRYTGRKRPDKF